MHSILSRTLTAATLALALAVGAGGALAATDGSDYGSAELVQAGYGPAGPPAAVRTLAHAATDDAGRDYGSAALVQLGHGPGGPPQAAS